MFYYSEGVNFFIAQAKQKNYRHNDGNFFRIELNFFG